LRKKEKQSVKKPSLVKGVSADHWLIKERVRKRIFYPLREEKLNEKEIFFPLRSVSLAQGNSHPSRRLLDSLHFSKSSKSSPIPDDLNIIWGLEWILEEGTTLDFSRRSNAAKQRKTPSSSKLRRKRFSEERKALHFPVEKEQRDSSCLS